MQSDFMPTTIAASHEQPHAGAMHGAQPVSHSAALGPSAALAEAPGPGPAGKAASPKLLQPSGFPLSEATALRALLVQQIAASNGSSAAQAVGGAPSVEDWRSPPSHPEDPPAVQHAVAGHGAGLAMHVLSADETAGNMLSLSPLGSGELPGTSKPEQQGQEQPKDEANVEPSKMPYQLQSTKARSGLCYSRDKIKTLLASGLDFVAVEQQLRQLGYQSAEAIKQLQSAWSAKSHRLGDALRSHKAHVAGYRHPRYDVFLVGIFGLQAVRELRADKGASTGLVPPFEFGDYSWQAEGADEEESAPVKTKRTRKEKPVSAASPAPSPGALPGGLSQQALLGLLVGQAADLAAKVGKPPAPAAPDSGQQLPPVRKRGRPAKARAAQALPPTPSPHVVSPELAAPAATLRAGIAAQPSIAAFAAAAGSPAGAAALPAATGAAPAPTPGPFSMPGGLGATPPDMQRVIQLLLRLTSSAEGTEELMSGAHNAALGLGSDFNWTMQIVEYLKNTATAVALSFAQQAPSPKAVP